jgi:hypothetical protein
MPIIIKHLKFINKGSLMEESLRMGWGFSVDAPVSNKITTKLK